MTETKGKAAVEKLQAEGLDVSYHPLDVTNSDSVQRLAQFIKSEEGKLDILVNNAGVLIDASDSLLDTKIDTLRETIDTNLSGPLLLCQALIPLMREHNYGRVVNVSSGAGQLSEMTGGYPAIEFLKQH